MAVGAAIVVAAATAVEAAAAIAGESYVEVALRLVYDSMESDGNCMIRKMISTISLVAG